MFAININEFKVLEKVIHIIIYIILGVGVGVATNQNLHGNRIKYNRMMEERGACAWVGGLLHVYHNHNHKNLCACVGEWNVTTIRFQCECLSVLYIYEIVSAQNK